MKIIIMRPDNMVRVNGEERDIDCSSLSPTIKAIRIDTTLGKGIVEFMDYDEATGDPITKLPDQIITAVPDVPGLDTIVQLWQNWTPPVIPPPSPEALLIQAYEDYAKSDPSLLALRTKTPTEIEAYVQANTNNLTEVRNLLTKMAVVMGYTLTRIV